MGVVLRLRFRPSLSLCLYEHHLDTQSLTTDSHCTACDCEGLHPGQDVTLVLDDTLAAASVLAEPAIDDHPNHYLALCACGHALGEHGLSDELPEQEILRRGKVAIRLDELLQVKVHLTSIFLFF